MKLMEVLSPIWETLMGILPLTAILAVVQLLILSEKSKVKGIMKAMVEVGRLKEPGTGIIFTLPISDLVGLHHREEFED